MIDIAQPVSNLFITETILALLAITGAGILWVKIVQKRQEKKEA